MFRLCHNQRCGIDFSVLLLLLLFFFFFFFFNGCFGCIVGSLCDLSSLIRDPAQAWQWKHQFLTTDCPGIVFISILLFLLPLVVQMAKNLPAMQETWVWSLGWEDPLKYKMATHSSMFPWRIPWDREAELATVHVVAKSQTLTEQPTLSLYFDSIHRSHTNISS